MVESTPLLRERSGNATEGSNPSRSAIAPARFTRAGAMALADGMKTLPRGLGSNAAAGRGGLGKSAAQPHSSIAVTKWRQSLPFRPDLGTTTPFIRKPWSMVARSR